MSALLKTYTPPDSVTVKPYLPPNPATARPQPELDPFVSELLKLQKHRRNAMKFRIGPAARLESIIAGELGYESKMEDKDRKGYYEKARKHIKDSLAKKIKSPHERMIECVERGSEPYIKYEAELDYDMLKLARKLPIASWIKLPNQRGCSLQYLSVIIGETGDLGKYSNPAKVWRRLGLCPWTYDGNTAMGSTWAKKGLRALQELPTLPDDQWSDFGYSPRRRAVSFMLGEGLIRANMRATREKRGKENFLVSVDWTGPYRQKWIDAKIRAFDTHPEWPWHACDCCEAAAARKQKCEKCGGLGQTCGHAHSHGRILASKLFLKELWIAWNS